MSSRKSSKKKKNKKSSFKFVRVELEGGEVSYLTGCGCPGSKSNSFRKLIDMMGMTDIVTLLREDEPGYQKSIKVSKFTYSGKIRFHHYPISGRKMELKGDVESIRNGVSTITGLMKSNRGCKIVVHCAAGQHRTGLFLYILLRNNGFSMEKSMELIREMRVTTYDELEKHTRKGGVLKEKSELMFQKLFC